MPSVPQNPGPAPHEPGVLGITPFGEPDARLAAAVCRAGALGVLDLGTGDRRGPSELADLTGPPARSASASPPAPCPRSPPCCPSSPATAPPRTPWSWRPTRPGPAQLPGLPGGCRVLKEVAGQEAAAAAGTAPTA